MYILGFIIGVLILVAIMGIAYKIESKTVWMEEDEEHIVAKLQDETYLLDK